MKKLILMVVSVFFFASTAFAIEVPAAVSKAFAQKFPTVKKVKWEKENEADYEAEFELNGVETSATFASDGTWKETESEINVSELPAQVLAAVEKLHPGTKIKEASKITRANNTVIYEAEIKKGLKETELLFDANGTAVK